MQKKRGARRRGRASKMRQYNEILSRCPLFEGVSESERDHLLNCKGASYKTFFKGESIFSAGDKPRHIGILLSGAATVERVDYYGNRAIIAHISPSELFGESFAFTKAAALPVSVAAAADSTALLIPAREVVETCTKACAFHNRIIFNLLQIISEKNFSFHQKIEILSRRTTREKLMTYLLFQAKSQRNKSFFVPFDRQGLADYLGVDRSGLSAEIAKLRKEGILSCHKNAFSLL